MALTASPEKAAKCSLNPRRQPLVSPPRGPRLVLHSLRPVLPARLARPLFLPVSPEPDPISAAWNRASRVAAGCSRPGVLPGGSERRQHSPRPGSLRGLGRRGQREGPSAAAVTSRTRQGGRRLGASAGLLDTSGSRRWSVKEGARRLKEREGPGM